jgi:hypothetical protein
MAFKTKTYMRIKYRFRYYEEHFVHCDIIETGEVDEDGKPKVEIKETHGYRIKIVPYSLKLKVDKVVKVVLV